jgi:hypothetical protein
MRKKIVRAGLAAVLMLGFVGIGQAAPIGVSLSGFDDSIVPVDAKPAKAKPFKLMGAGQIDTSTFTLEFAGKATQLGKYTATGQVDPSTFQIQGVITDTDDHSCAGDNSIRYTAGFQFGPLGDLVATFVFSGGTGKFAHATGTASGPVVLDAAYMFTIVLQGSITY